MGAVDGAAAALVPFVAVEDPNPTQWVRLKIYDTACGGGCAVGQSETRFTWTKAQQPEVLTHEAGHIMFYREWDGEAGGNNTTKNDPSGTWSPWSDEYEEVTLVEGSATYIGVVAYYDPENSNVVPIFGGNDTERNVFQGVSCSNAYTRVGTAVRGLWDIDDVVNESADATVTSGYADATDLPSWFILGVLSNFPSGTGNRQRGESDDNGPNMRDYAVNAGLGITSSRSLIHHNCLELQDNN